METVKGWIDMAVYLYTLSPGGVFHSIVLVLFIVVPVAILVVAFNISNLLHGICNIMLGLAYRLSPAMQATDAETEKIRAGAPRLGLRELLGGKPAPKPLPKPQENK